MTPPLHWQFILGNIFLDQFECPEEFDIGWEKNLAVHRYLSQNGTTKIVTQTLGIYPVSTKWTGTLFYQTAMERFQQIEALATQTEPVVWQYGPLQYLVQIKSVIGHVKYQFEIDYEIEVVVVQSGNQTVPFSDVQVGGSLSAQTFYDNGNAAYNSLSTPGVNPFPIPLVVTQEFVKVNALINANTPFSAATLQVLAAITIAIDAFVISVNIFNDSLKAQALNEAGCNQLLEGIALAANYQQLGTYVKSLIGQTPDSTMISAPAGTSLYALAAQFYPQNDPAQGAQTIASANGLFDLFLPNDMVLTIPPVFIA